MGRNEFSYALWILSLRVLLGMLVAPSSCPYCLFPLFAFFFSLSALRFYATVVLPVAWLPVGGLVILASLAFAFFEARLQRMSAHHAPVVWFPFVSFLLRVLSLCVVGTAVSGSQLVAICLDCWPNDGA